MVRIVINCDDPDTRRKWRHIRNEIDTDADYEEIVSKLYDFFEEDENRYESVNRAAREPEFR